MTYKEINGDLIKLAKEGKFDVVAHGCNCWCTMKSGIAPQMAENFHCDSFPLENIGSRGIMDKLGNIDYQTILLNKHHLHIVNAYTQYRPGSYLSYEALILCLKKINHQFNGLHIGLPLIGCGIAGGDWNVVKKLIQENLASMAITIVCYDK